MVLSLPIIVPHRSNTGEDHAGNPANDHCLAQRMMPAAYRTEQKHRAADHKSRVSDGAGQSLDIAAEATSQGLQTGKSAQVAFRNAPKDASRVAGRVHDQTLHVARKTGGLALQSFR